MIMPIDIDKKEFTRDKRGYNSREVDEFLDLIVVDYEKILNDNRAMAHKIKSLEKQLEEAQKSDTAMVDTLQTAKKLMSDISASAERRAELMMRDAELEAENILMDAKVTVRNLNDEHLVLSGKVERLRKNFRRLLENELARLDEDEYDLLKDMDRSDIDAPKEAAPEPAPAKTIVITNDEPENAVVEEVVEETVVTIEETAPAEEIVVPTLEDIFEEDTSKNESLSQATISDLSESLKKMADETAPLDSTIILK